MRDKVLYFNFFFFFIPTLKITFYFELSSTAATSSGRPKRNSWKFPLFILYGVYQYFYLRNKFCLCSFTSFVLNKNTWCSITVCKHEIISKHIKKKCNGTLKIVNLDWIIMHKFCPVSWLVLCRGVRLPPSLHRRVSWIWHETIWWWGSSNAGALGNAEYVAHRSTRTWSGSTW